MATRLETDKNHLFRISTTSEETLQRAQSIASDLSRLGFKPQINAPRIRHEMKSKTKPRPVSTARLEKLEKVRVLVGGDTQFTEVVKTLQSYGRKFASSNITTVTLQELSLFFTIPRVENLEEDQVSQQIVAGGSAGGEKRYLDLNVVDLTWLLHAVSTEVEGKSRELAISCARQRVEFYRDLFLQHVPEQNIITQYEKAANTAELRPWSGSLIVQMVQLMQTLHPAVAIKKALLDLSDKRGTIAVLNGGLRRPTTIDAGFNLNTGASRGEGFNIVKHNEDNDSDERKVPKAPPSSTPRNKRKRAEDSTKVLEGCAGNSLKEARML